jgi:surfactin synthase thioesterase subunit
MNHRKQVFFLHFAGGSFHSYDFLIPHLNNFDCYQLELPGRGKRVAEPLLYTFEEAVADYTQQILSLLKRGEFMIYGHSMGATLGAFVTSRLERLGYVPNLLLTTGNPGPGLDFNKNRYKMNKTEFLLELKKIGGMPQEFFQHSELIDYFMPILKADFQIVELNTKEKLPPLRSPFMALMGQDEELVNQIDNWRKYVKGYYESRVLDGHHFFIHQHVSLLVDIIQNAMNNQYSRLRTTRTAVGM